MEFIQSASSSPTFSAFSSELNAIGALFQSKLWHQMASQLTELAAKPEFRQQQRLLTLFNQFISKCAESLNPLIVSQLALDASEQCNNPSETAVFVRKAMEIKTVNEDPEASLLLLIRIAVLTLQAGNHKECVSNLEEAKEAIDTSPREMVTLVSSAYYQAKMEYHKVMGTASQFFRNALLYLSYTDTSDLSAEAKISLATELGLAALAGDDIYNFGEFLEHEILQTLEGSAFDWLHRLLYSFNEGDIDRFEVIFREQSPHHEILRNNDAFLRQKIRIMNLMEMVFRRRSDDRNLTFAEIATVCKVPTEEVELLLMKATSLGVIKALIDQVDATVRIKWVQPRVLSASQIEGLRDRLSQWSAKVDENVLFLDNNAPELLGR